ncbi:MAG: hypothetical protein OJF51_002703 [Nitrospira sp.]|jgi:hypothetical protein|nr:MAG: hypothetical protein OJF51_002703 [Nitrospira sp.]
MDFPPIIYYSPYFYSLVIVMASLWTIRFTFSHGSAVRTMSKASGTFGVILLRTHHRCRGQTLSNRRAVRTEDNINELVVCFAEDGQIDEIGWTN